MPKRVIKNITDYRIGDKVIVRQDYFNTYIVCGSCGDRLLCVSELDMGMGDEAIPIYEYVDFNDVRIESFARYRKA